MFGNYIIILLLYYKIIIGLKMKLYIKLRNT